MYLNSPHLRFGAIAAGVLLLGGYLLLGGPLGGDRIVLLDFSMYPEVFEGCEVEIDGEVAGMLRADGRSLRTEFEVRRGEHVLRIRHPQYDSQQVTVNMESPSEKARLVLDLEERFDHRTRSPKLLITIGI